MKTKTKLEIWKLQRPMFTNGLIEVMAYTEDKEQMAFIKMDKKTIKKLFGDEYKIYVLAENNHKDLVIDCIVEEQDW